MRSNAFRVKNPFSLISPAISFSLSSFALFLLLYTVTISSYLSATYLQYLSEIFFISLSSILLFYTRINKFYFYSFLLILLFFLIGFPSQSFPSFVNSFRFFLVLIFSFFLSQFGYFDSKNLFKVVNLFFIVNIFFTLFIPDKLIWGSLASNLDLLSTGRGGLFFNFHLNGFLTSLWLFNYSRRFPLLIIPSCFLIYYTTSLQSIIIFILALIFFYGNQFIQYFSLIRFFSNSKAFILFLFLMSITFSILFLSSLDDNSLKELSGSFYIILRQFKFIDFSFIPLFPTDIDNLYSIYFSYGTLSISNEISLFDLIYRFGVLGFCLIYLLLYAAFPSLICFFIPSPIALFFPIFTTYFSFV